MVLKSFSGSEGFSVYWLLPLLVDQTPFISWKVFRVKQQAYKETPYLICFTPDAGVQHRFLHMSSLHDCSEQRSDVPDVSVTYSHLSQWLTYFCSNNSEVGWQRPCRAVNDLQNTPS